MPYKDVERQREYLKSHYLQNKQKYVGAIYSRRDRNSQLILEYKQGKTCEVCGNDNPVLFDFHHLEGKELEITNAVHDWGIKRIKRELDKCQILCANCHRKKHYSDSCQKRIGTSSNCVKRNRNRDFVNSYKQQNPCCQCGESDIGCLDFHHDGEKDINISRAVCDWGINRLQKEIEKCKVLCANCHRLVHSESGTGPYKRIRNNLGVGKHGNPPGLGQEIAGSNPAT